MARTRPHVPEALEWTAAVAWRGLVVAAALALVTAVLVELRLVVFPVLLALLLSTALVPPARWLERRGAPSLLATGVVCFLALGILVGAILLLAPRIAEELAGMREGIAGGIRAVLEWASDGPLNISQSDLDRYVQQAAEQLQNSAGAIASGILGGVVAVAEIAAAILLTAVLVFFFVKDGEAMSGWLLDRAPKARRDAIRRGARRGWDVLGAFVRGTAVVGIVDALAIGLGLVLIGVPLVAPLMVLTFFGAFLPLVGAVLAGAVAALVALATEGVVAALLVLGVVIVVQQVEGDVVAPLVLGRNLKLHPVVIVLVIAAGAVVGGIGGAFIAVPLTAVVVGVTSELRGDGG